MTPEQFCYWLQGVLECGAPQSLTPEQLKCVKDHLATVFKKVTPEYSGLGALLTQQGNCAANSQAAQAGLGGQRFC